MLRTALREVRDNNTPAYQKRDTDLLNQFILNQTNQSRLCGDEISDLQRGNIRGIGRVANRVPVELLQFFVSI